MAQLISLEACIEKTLEQQSQAVADYPDGVVVFQEILQLTHTHCRALETRLKALVDNVSTPHKTDKEFQIDNRYPMSASLRRAYVLLNEAIIDYTTLRILALRFRDSPVTGEENTADLADLHMQCLQ
jgi:hypothetical protein